MATIRCSKPCRFNVGAPVGEHDHHYHSFSEPDCIMEEAKFRFGITEYTYSETEYQNLRSLAKKMHLSHEVIHDLDHNYEGAHSLCEYRLLKRGRMNAIAGMCWDIAIKNYHDVAELIERICHQYNASSSLQ